MKTVLIVEDSPMVMRIIKHVVAQSPHIQPLYAESLAQARAHLEHGAEPAIFAALVDLALPDAPNGEIVDVMLANRIPTIVLTATFDQDKREQLLAKGIVDYVTKEGRFSYLYACNLVHRLIKNQQVPVLVADDSLVSRKLVVNLLKLHRYPVFEAQDGEQALATLLENPGIRLLVTDYNMPRMDGFELVQALRVKHVKSELVIIGVSSEGDGHLTARFIKAGANDFIKKPFNHEEFFCRITHNVELLEMIETIRDGARRDQQTGIYNRQYFFEKGWDDWQQSTAKKIPISLAIIDLDNFRFINETYGQDGGDAVMLQFAKRLEQSLERFLVARADGQEFYVLMSGLTQEKACALLKRFAQVCLADPFVWNQHKIGLAFSAGVAEVKDGTWPAPEAVNTATKAPFEALLSQAYLNVLRAKEAGGDMVIGDDLA
jgi:diguanylate cyclase (GGDEF)-like protein